MFTELRPYPRTTRSHIPWSPDLPAHWAVRRGKALFMKVDREPRPGDGVVTCFRDGVVTLRSRRRTTGFTESLKEIGYQGIRRGDLVIHAMDAFAGAAGVSDSDGKGTPVYSVCVPRGDADPHYYAAVVREMARTSWIQALSRGIRERSTDFRFEMFATQMLPVPPADEQAAIVKYLAHANARIDKAIAAKRRLLRLLEEEREAIQLAVVTGAREALRCPTPSRWFPVLPPSWDVVPLGRVIQFAIDGPHFSPNYVDNGYPFLSARNIRADRWLLDDVKFISKSDFETFNRRVEPLVDDVLYTKGGTTGVARVVDLPFPFQVWVHVAVLRLSTSLIDPHFLAMALNSRPCYEQSQLETRGATNQDLGLGRMKRIELPLPLKQVQFKLVEDFAESTRDIATMVERATREIELLQEFRTRLVADVVTGQLDVREVAKSLPAFDHEIGSVGQLSDIGEFELDEALEMSEV